MTRRQKKYFVTTRELVRDGCINHGYPYSSLRAAFSSMLKQNDGYLAGIKIRKEVYNSVYMHYIRNIKSGKIWHDKRIYRTEEHVNE